MDRSDLWNGPGSSNVNKSTILYVFRTAAINGLV